MTPIYRVTIRFQTAILLTDREYFVSNLEDVQTLKVAEKAGQYKVTGHTVCHLMKPHEVTADIRKEKREHEKHA